MDRKLYNNVELVFKDPFDTPEEYATVFSYKCPHCGIGNINITEASLRNKKISNCHQYPDDEIEEFEQEFVFADNFKCHNCGSYVAVSGTITYCTNDELKIVGTKFIPIYFQPAPNVIEIPSEYLEDPNAKELVSIIKSSYPLYWCDKSACSNRIRTSLEELLVYLNIGNKDGKTLGDKIKPLKQSQKQDEKDLYDLLEVMKDFTNKGSHTNNIKNDNDAVLDAYELLEHLLVKYNPQKAKKLQSAKYGLEKFRK